jgi:hypothetical protein
MSTRKDRDVTQRPAETELQDLETDGLQELTAEDASAVRGGGAPSNLMQSCATGVHIQKATITP